MPLPTILTSRDSAHTYNSTKICHSITMKRGVQWRQVRINCFDFFPGQILSHSVMWIASCNFTTTRHSYQWFCQSTEYFLFLFRPDLVLNFTYSWCCSDNQQWKSRKSSICNRVHHSYALSSPRSALMMVILWLSSYLTCWTTATVLMRTIGSRSLTDLVAFEKICCHLQFANNGATEKRKWERCPVNLLVSCGKPMRLRDSRKLW